MAHLFIVEAEKPGWLNLGLSTHPLVSERIDLLARMVAGISPSILEDARRAGAEFAYVPTGVATPSPGSEKAFTFRDAAIWGITVGVVVYGGFLVLWILSLAGKGDIGQSADPGGYIAGFGTATAFGVAAYLRKLEGWKLGLAIVVMFYAGLLGGLMRESVIAPCPSGGTCALFLDFFWGVGLISLAGAVGAFIGSKEGWSWLTGGMP